MNTSSAQPPVSKRQFQSEHPDLLQQKHEMTVKNIQELQELEKYMFQNLQNINQADSSSANESAIIQKRIEELSAMRQNLFQQLKNMYTNVQQTAASNRGDLADQIAVVNIVEKELNAAKANLNELINEKNNKLRMVQIGEYNTDRYVSHKDMLKKIVYGCVVIILISLLMGLSWFPKIVGVVGIILTIAITLGLIASNLYENWTRSNLVWAQFQQPYDKELAAERAAGTYTSVWDLNKASASKLWGDIKSQTSAGIDALQSGDAAAAVTGSIQGVIGQAAAQQGQIGALQQQYNENPAPSTSTTSEGFAPF